LAIPLLNYAPKSQNVRVAGYDVGGDEKPRVYTTENVLSPSDLDDLIEAAYRQIFFHAFKWDREPFLESQLRNGQLSVRDFIRGLLLSKTFYNSFYEKNSNYRFVEQVVQRVLGRDVYSEREKKLLGRLSLPPKGFKVLSINFSTVTSICKALVMIPFPTNVVAPWPAEKSVNVHSTSPRLATMATIVVFWASPKSFGRMLSVAMFPKSKNPKLAILPASWLWPGVSVVPKAILYQESPL